MKYSASLCLCICLSLFVFGQPGSYDSTFGINGKVKTLFNVDALASALAIAPNGKIIVAGVAYTAGNNLDFAVARYNKNGAIDKTFGTGGKVVTPVSTSFSDEARAVAIQADGKILVAGSSNGDAAIVRYTINGSLDNTFGSDGKVIKSIGTIDYVQAIAILQDGSILVAGYTRINDFDFVLLKYTIDGMPDNSFGTDGIVITNFGNKCDDAANAIALQTNGMIVLAGTSVNTITGENDIALARYNVNGQPDMNFGINGKLVAPIDGFTTGEAMAIQQDGKIIVGGSLVSDENTVANYLLARFKTDGNIDSTFGINGLVKGPRNSSRRSIIKSVAVQANKKIIAAGTFNSNTGNRGLFTARCDEDGTKDESFANESLLASNNANLAFWYYVSAAIQPDEKILIAGSYDYAFGLVRLKGDDTNLATYSVQKPVNDKHPAINIYPNPVGNQLHIEGLANGNATLIITDISGNFLIQLSAGGKSFTADVNKLKPGRYIANISQDGKTTSLNFIKQ